MKNQDRIISNNDNEAEEFNSFFENAVKSCNVKPRNLILGDITNASNPLEIAIKKFENHLGVQIIKENISVNKEFHFKEVEVDDILKEMKN